MIKLINISFSKIFSSYPKINSDIIGAFASALCMLHCLATPIFFIASVCSSSCCSNTPTWWQGIDYFFLGVSFLSILQATKSTTKTWVSTGLWINWSFLLVIIINMNLEWFQLVENIKFIPAMALVGLHFYNMKYCQCSENECC